MYLWRVLYFVRKVPATVMFDRVFFLFPSLMHYVSFGVSFFFWHTATVMSDRVFFLFPSLMHYRHRNTTVRMFPGMYVKCIANIVVLLFFFLLLPCSSSSSPSFIFIVVIFDVFFFVLSFLLVHAWCTQNVRCGVNSPPPSQSLFHILTCASILPEMYNRFTPVPGSYQASMMMREEWWRWRPRW